MVKSVSVKLITLVPKVISWQPISFRLLQSPSYTTICGLEILTGVALTSVNPNIWISAAGAVGEKANHTSCAMFGPHRGGTGCGDGVASTFVYSDGPEQNSTIGPKKSAVLHSSLDGCAIPMLRVSSTINVV